MNQPSSHFITCNELELHYSAWGEPTAPAVVLWHGLTRTGRDFDELALALSANYYVICPDTIGRGLSEWAKNPETDYTAPVYAQIAIQLLDQLGIASCDWVGTSMGGIIGMVVTMFAPTRIKKLVLNDVGPEVPKEAIERIKLYTAIQPEFANFAQVERWLRQVYVPFGANTDAFWQRMAITSTRRKDNGKLTLHYDPKLTLAFRDNEGTTLWEQWSNIQAPILVIRGADSDVLLAEHATRMVTENPQARLVTISGVAHAPTLANAEQIELVTAFLQA